MSGYAWRRLASLAPTLFFASIIVFMSVRLIPGDVIDLMLSDNGMTADPTARAKLLAALGLDRPMWAQYLSWSTDIVLRGDFGTSLWTGTSVTQTLLERMPVTLELGLLSLLVSLTVAIPIGIFAAIRQDTAIDYVTRSLSILLLAIPSFWLGTLAMVLPSIWWGWTPEIRYVPFFTDPMHNLSQMLLPAIILGTSLAAITMRMTRTMMLEVLRQDYIRTAWAKGLSERRIVIRHALRNALIPVVTLIGLQAPILIGGAVILEQIFVIPGIGLLLLDAVSTRDYPIVTGVFLVVGLLVMLINLLIDLSYGWLDPKVRYG
ncbi:ABC transporter permease [Achromobacter sp. GG226]|uniref:ABC transporter permease n=1 Tax=Verticiella alkaliphila TaxID=2779529 RepID=UPI001C0AA6E6|nr:ABC transporter permease [Verticiella sp. GG226]MBU4610656.1 ABC transporter permease [Verticiella sp. GG226]